MLKWAEWLKEVNTILTNIVEETVYLNINADANSGTSNLGSRDTRRKGKHAVSAGL